MSVDTNFADQPLCDRCADPTDAEEINVEAFEISGQIVCAGCADEIFGERE